MLYDAVGQKNYDELNHVEANDFFADGVFPGRFAPHHKRQQKETDRLENCGTVVMEILDIPDDLPQDVLDKAECVIIFPSVLKAAFVFGGSYTRGAMTRRTGEHFTGPCGAPAMMVLEGGSFGLQLGGQATDFVLLVMNPRSQYAQRTARREVWIPHAN